MYIVIKIKEDLKQNTYWSGRLVDDSDGKERIMLEVVSLTFDLYNNFTKWKEFEKVNNRMAMEMMKECNKGSEHNITLSRMLLAPSKFDMTENRN